MLATQTSGRWSHLPTERIRNFGRPYSAHTHMLGMVSLRIFFQDLQEWEVIRARFEPYRAFRAPRSITSLIERNPRIIADDVWAKLVWAGINVTADDLSRQGRAERSSSHYYPLALVRALTMVWLFAGIRWYEIRRLRLGCIRWQENTEHERVCLLSIPVNKTGTAYSKPVDKLVGEAIEAWEKERPQQSKVIDTKTGEQVDFLFPVPV
jgi:integrase